jgi:hypothetical protein
MLTLANFIFPAESGIYAIVFTGYEVDRNFATAPEARKAERLAQDGSPGIPVA